MEMDTGKFIIYRILKGGIDTSPVEKIYTVGTLEGYFLPMIYILMMGCDYAVCTVGADSRIFPPALLHAQLLLYCTVLYCTVLYCTVLFCTALIASDVNPIDSSLKYEIKFYVPEAYILHFTNSCYFSHHTCLPVQLSY